MAALSSTHADVAIIGAGPAGCAAAIRLARAGKHVLLIEKHRFPRDKVCGGCLSGPAVRELAALLECGPEAASKPGNKLPGTPVARISFMIAGRRLSCAVRGATRIVRRSELDDRLAQTAELAGAELRFGAPADLRRSNHGWEILLGERVIRAHSVLVASGLSTLLARLAARSGMDRSRPPLPGFSRNTHHSAKLTWFCKGLLAVAAPDCTRRLVAQQWIQPRGEGFPDAGQVQMHWLRGGYVGLAALDEHSCIVALAAEQARDARAGPLNRLRQRNPDSTLWRAINESSAASHGSRGAAGFPWRPNQLFLDNLLLIGDAAGYEEPFSGAGMAGAFHSARWAAHALLTSPDNPGPAYARLMRRFHRPTLLRTRILSRILRSRLVEALMTSSGPSGCIPASPTGALLRWVHVGGIA